MRRRRRQKFPVSVSGKTRTFSCGATETVWRENIKYCGHMNGKLGKTNSNLMAKSSIYAVKLRWNPISLIEFLISQESLQNFQFNLFIILLMVLSNLKPRRAKFDVGRGKLFQFNFQSNEFYFRFIRGTQLSSSTKVLNCFIRRFFIIVSSPCALMAEIFLASRRPSCKTGRTHKISPARWEWRRQRKSFRRHTLSGTRESYWTEWV